MMDDSSDREPGIRVPPSLLSLCNGGMMVGRAGQDQQSQLLPWQPSVSSVTRKGSDSDMGPGSAIDCGMLKAHLKGDGWLWGRFDPCSSPHHWSERNLGKQEVWATSLRYGRYLLLHWQYWALPWLTP